MSARWPSTDRHILPLCLLVGVVAWVVYAWAARPWFATGDAAWLSDVARHVAEGRGLTTSVTLPAYLMTGDRTAVDLNPQFQTPPGYPLLLGLFFRLFGPSELTALVLQGFLQLILIFLTYVTARRFLSPAAAGLAASVVAVEPGMLEHALVANAYPLFGVAVLGICYMLVGAGSALRRAALGGLLLATAQLIRFNAGSLVFAFAALVATTPRSRRHIPIFLGSWLAALALSFLLTGNAATSVSGSASLLLETPSYPGWSIQGVLTVPPLGEAITIHAKEIAAKGVAGLRFHLRELPTVGNPLLMGGALIAGLLLSGLPAARPLVLFAAIGTATTVAVASLIEFNIALLRFMLPIYVVLVVWALEHHATAQGLARAVVLLLALIVYGGETARLARDTAPRAEQAAAISRLGAALTADASPDEWIASDIPATLTWHSRLPTVRLPNRPEDLSALEVRRRPLTRVVVTSIAVNPRSRFYPDDAWQRVLDARLLEGFTVERTVEDQQLRAVVFRKTHSAPTTAKSPHSPLPVVMQLSGGALHTPRSPCRDWVADPLGQRWRAEHRERKFARTTLRTQSS